MASGLIFITGATGFIGSNTALTALKAGYRLRIAVRQESQIEKLKSVLSGYEDRLEFAIVPDIVSESAYAGKLDGVDYVLHIASPLARTLDKRDYFGPATKGTLNILEEASKVSSVKRVVITSSIIALVPITGLPEGQTVTEDSKFDLSVDVESDFTGPVPAATAFKLYHASKLLAHQATLDFKKEKKPHYDIITVHPSFAYGHDLLQTTSEGIGGTNSLLWGALTSGQPATNPSFVNVRDVATAHVRALNPTIPDGSSYILVAKAPTWKEVARVLKKNYPNVSLFKLSEDTTANATLPSDGSKAERDLGFSYESLETTIKEVVDQNLSLIKSSA